VDALLRAAHGAAPERRRAVLEGMAEALRGWIKATPPPAWKELAVALAQDAPGPVREIGVVFGDGRAAGELLKIAGSKGQDLETRKGALRALAGAKPDGFLPLLQKLLADADIAAEAVRCLAAVDPPDLVETLLAHVGKLNRPAREAAIDALSSKPSYARALLDAVGKETVDRAQVTAFQLRRMQLFDDAELNRRIAAAWPDLRLIGEDKLKRIAQLRALLTPERLAAADRRKGLELYKASCGKCHKLFGEGGTIGPDMTGGQRNNLSYLLENVVDPSAAVAEGFRLSVLGLADGRILNGVVVERTDRTISVQTAEERLVLDRKSVQREKASALSLMPDGLLDVLTPEQIADLFAFVMGAGPP
jgi:putative heme-binding domain-containing protein